MPCLSKLFNSIHSSRLQKIFETNKVIHETHLGLQPKARISDQVLRKLIKKYQSLNSKLYTYFIYFEKKRLIMLFIVLRFTSFAMLIYLVCFTMLFRACVQRMTSI